MLLDQVRQALRITTSAFDEEIKGLIDAAVEEMDYLGIRASELAPTSAEVQSAIIAFCKWQFGNNPDAERWEKIYIMKVGQLKLAKGYRC